jgi:Sec-independent protein translocase protein TatA
MMMGLVAVGFWVVVALAVFGGPGAISGTVRMLGACVRTLRNWLRPGTKYLPENLRKTLPENLREKEPR